MDRETKVVGRCFGWIHSLVFQAIKAYPVFTTEQQVSADTNLSRIDVNHAVAQLEHVGVIVFTKGAISISPRFQRYCIN